MSECENGQLPLAKRTIRSRISSERWEQIKTAYAAGIGLREIARKMNIPQGTVLAHAKRHGWTQQIQVATQQQSDAITPVQSVPQSLAAILSERKERTRLGLSRFTAEAAEQAAEHRDKLGIAGKVKDVASVHSTLWPEEKQESLIDGGILIGLQVVTDNPEEIRELRRLEIEKKELPCPVIDIDANEKLPDAQEKVPEAQPVNSLWEEPRESAVIFKRRRSRGG
jgi:hypothetical protein